MTTRYQDEFIELMSNHYGSVHVRHVPGSQDLIATPTDDDRPDKAVYVSADDFARPATRAEYESVIPTPR
jgi:hypothetical protein